MGLILFFLFLATPLIEIAIFINVGGLIGLWPALAVVILTAMLGAALWRAQGLAVWARAQTALQRGELPVKEVADGAFLLVAGALLLTPGFATDTIGFLLFVPPFRRWLARRVFEHMSRNMKVHVHHSGPGPRHPGPGHGGPVIDGDAVTRDD